MSERSSIAVGSSPVVSVDAAGMEEDPEIVAVSPRAAFNSTAPSTLLAAAAASSPPSSPPAQQSPLSSPTASTAPPSSRRAASSGSGSGSGNGYVSAQQKRANMDLTGLGSPPASGDSNGGGAPSNGLGGGGGVPGRGSLEKSSSASFLSSFAKKLTLNTAAGSSSSAANAASSPAAASSKSSTQTTAATGNRAVDASATASSPPTGRLSGSSSAALSLSPAAAAVGSSSSSSTASSAASAAPLSPSASSSATAAPGKRSFGSSLGSMFRSGRDSGSGSGSGSGGASGGGGALTQTEQQKEQQKKEWLSMLPQLNANGLVAATPAAQSYTSPKIKAKCAKLVWFGIPSSVRGDAWQWIIGNSLNITEDLFWIMSGRAQEVKESKMRRLEREEADREASNGSNGAKANTAETQQQASHKANLSREESVSIIDTDVLRTFPELKFFHDGGPLQAPLYQVLESYGCYRPDVGYVQGMSHIAAMLLLNMEPLAAFIAQCNLLNQPMYFKFFRMNAEQMKVHLDVFQQVFRDQLPQLVRDTTQYTQRNTTEHGSIDSFNHFASLGIEPDMYLYDWLLTIFTRALPLDVTTRVWDNFLCVGHVFLFRTALGLLRLQQPAFMQADFERSLALLNRPPRDIDGEQLFECIGRIAVTADKLNKMLHEAEGG